MRVLNKPMPPQTLDPPGMMAKIAGMMRRLIANAVHSSIEELLAKPLGEINDQLKELREGQRAMQAAIISISIRLDETNQRIDKLGARLDARIDALSDRMDGLSDRMDGLSERMDGLSDRMDEFGVQQGRIIEEVAGLRRDRDMNRDILHRMARIEDRVFAKAG